MRKTLNILFYENGDPMEYRCIERSLLAFPRGYWKVVRKVIETTNSGLNEQIFKYNVGILLPSFKMTRAGVFEGISVDKTGILRGDEFHAVDKCWEAVQKELIPLKKYIDNNVRSKRGRVLVELATEAEEHIIEIISHLFKQLSKIEDKNRRGGQSKVGPVAASKILFSVLPEIALPVDTAEWKDVFCTDDFAQVLRQMLTEIKQWEDNAKQKLDELDKDKMTTLPAIYNVLAMGARPL